MAARKRRGVIALNDDWRAKIKAGVICQPLQAHLAGTLEMSPTQLRAAEVLLKKVLPDLQRTTIAGEADGAPVAFSIVKPW